MKTFWCFAPCTSSPCNDKKETKRCFKCELRAWEINERNTSMRMESFKAGADLGLDCFMNFKEKPIMPIIKNLEKNLNKIAKSNKLLISGSVRVFEKNGPMGKILDKIKREKVKVTVTQGVQLIFKIETEELINEAYKKLETFANKNKLVIYLELRCWIV